MSALQAPVLSPRERQVGGCCVAAVEPQLTASDAVDLAGVVKALADPTRLLIVDALRTAAPEAICQCELTPLFDMSQQALSKHLKVLTSAGVVGSERRGLWTYYFVIPGGLEGITAWLS
jgi:ArsR family transcriptional regulator, arsenate/arsenite/antimonite-responsive transcriptional repressor